MKIIIFVLTMIFVSEIALSQDKNSVEKDYAKNIVYFEYGTFFSKKNEWDYYYYSLNYERLISNSISLRIGYGKSGYSTENVYVYTNLLGHMSGEDEHYNHAAIIMLNSFTRSKNKLNIGLGTFILTDLTIKVTPAFNLSYRHQANHKNLFFCTGILFQNFQYYFHLGLGYIF